MQYKNNNISILVVLWYLKTSLPNYLLILGKHSLSMSKDINYSFFVFCILSKWIILFLIVICETAQNKISKWLYMIYLLLQTTISCKSCYRIEWTQNKNVNEKHLKRKKKWWKKNRRENATKQPDYRCYSIQLDSFPLFFCWVHVIFRIIVFARTCWVKRKIFLSTFLD